MTKVGMFFLSLLFLFAGVMAIRYAQLARRDSQSGGSGELQATVEENGEQIPPTEWMTEFTLTDQLGREFHSEQLDGKVWVGSFFFSRCPSTCREQNLRVAELQREYADRGLQLVSISCEPEYDTPNRLAVYADQFGANPEHWHFLTGDLDYIIKAGAEIFQISVSPQSHSDRIVIFDTEGNRIDALRTRDPQDFVKAKQILDELLPEKAAEDAV